MKKWISKREKHRSDIVALQCINRQRTNHFGFYSNILSVSEQTLYYRQGFKEIPFEKFVWLLWSIKESADKYQKRIVPGLVFSPTKINIQQINSPYRRTITSFGGSNGKIKITNLWRILQRPHYFWSWYFYFRSKIHDELISTVVSIDENFENIWWDIKSIDYAAYDNQSKTVRAFILERLNSILPVGHDLRIGRNQQGCPVVLKKTKEINIPVSLAHHDHFISYSFLLSHPYLQLNCKVSISLIFYYSFHLILLTGSMIYLSICSTDILINLWIIITYSRNYITIPCLSFNIFEIQINDYE